jgi:hypothetical protein
MNVLDHLIGVQGQIIRCRRIADETPRSRDGVGFSLRLPAQASGTIANLAPSLQLHG